MFAVRVKVHATDATTYFFIIEHFSAPFPKEECWMPALPIGALEASTFISLYEIPSGAMLRLTQWVQNSGSVDAKQHTQTGFAHHCGSRGQMYSRDCGS